MPLRRIAQPASEPVTLDEAKAHLRVTGTAEDAVIAALIAQARWTAENEIRRSLIDQTWEKTLDCFPEAIELPYPPVIAVTDVRYVDEDGATQTLSAPSYLVDDRSEPGWITPAYGYTWPATRATPNAVTVTYRAGYGASAASVPAPIRHWLLLMVAHYFENREASVPDGLVALPFASGLLDAFRVVQVA